MTTKKPTVKQLAARKLFAQRAKAGTLGGKRKANPAKKAAPKKTAPKRKANPVKAGPKLYTVGKVDAQNRMVYDLAHFRHLAEAKKYAQEYVERYPIRLGIKTKAL